MRKAAGIPQFLIWGIGLFMALVLPGPHHPAAGAAELTPMLRIPADPKVRQVGSLVRECRCHP